MKFKHTFHVFVDNFMVTYKQLLYRLVIGAIASIICMLCIYPFIKELINSSQFNSLVAGVKGFLDNLLEGNTEVLGSFSEQVRTAYESFMELLQTKMLRIVLSGLLLLFVILVERWFAGLGNYTTAAVINDRMALRADQPFLTTMIRTLNRSAVYNAIYVPLSLAYDLAVGIGMFFFIFYLLNTFIPFLMCLFLFTLVLVVAITLKMTFTTDWLPALVRGQMKQGEALVYTFSRKNKNTFNIMSNFAVLVLIIFGFNVATAICTLGVGLLLTVPSSYVILVCFELVNYYDREQIKYFIDKKTVVKPEKEHVPTREEFFRGEEDR